MLSLPSTSHNGIQPYNTGRRFAAYFPEMSMYYYSGTYLVYHVHVWISDLFYVRKKPQVSQKRLNELKKYRE